MVTIKPFMEDPLIAASNALYASAGDPPAARTAWAAARPFRSGWSSLGALGRHVKLTVSGTWISDILKCPFTGYYQPAGRAPKEIKKQIGDAADMVAIILGELAFERLHQFQVRQL